MYRTIVRLALLLTFVLFLLSCRKKAFDEYYGRPDNLAPDIYHQLNARGNFQNLLACIDKAGYKEILNGAGSWTLFAPNDSAFQQFLQQRGINGVSQLDSGTCQQIVAYGLAYNAFLKARLGNYQSNSGWVSNQAFKRRTAYYDGYYDDTIKNTQTPGLSIGQKVKALGSSRNGNFVYGDNNKYIPYFTENFVNANGLSASDYNYFYPNTPYTGFNVADAKVVNQDIVAENGIIHEIDKVLLPLPSLDQYLGSNPQYSEFKKLFDKYMVTFVTNQTASDRYKLLTGLTEPVYIKMFNNTLAFSPNNENYLKTQDNDGQANGWTMFVPKNDVLLNYLNTVILENYNSLEQLPIQILIDFLNAHMWQTTVWPSRFTTQNVQGEPAKFDPIADIVDKKILSNGIFYATSKVQQANVFSTVYGKAYLDPKYLLMTRLLDQNLRFIITVPTLKYTVLMLSDSVLRAAGYDYNAAQSQWQYTKPGTTTTTVSAAIGANLQRILAMHIVPTPNGQLDNLSGSGIVETYSGDYIKYNSNRFSSAGTQDSGYVLNVTGTKTASNGRSYYVDNMLAFSPKTIGASIVALGTSTTSQFYNFATLLKNADIFTPTTGDISGVTPGVFYTAFIPNNAMMQAAANAGWLPKKTNGSVNIDNASPAWTVADKNLINDFIRYHILNRTTVAPDGKKTGSFETVYKKANGDPGTLIINNGLNSMQITDNQGRNANLVLASSNNLAERAVIHLIDNYLQYSPN
jgi:uncharacterized surface protein with fasciclin (FAS1) repeats